MPADRNPYAAPRAAVEPPTPPVPAERSVVPRVFGVLSITFSGLFLLLLAFSIAAYALWTRPSVVHPAATQPTQPATRPTQPATHVSPDPPAGAMVCLGLGFLGGTLSLLVVGIGQVRYRRWAARGSVVWSVLVLALFIGAGVWAGLATPGAAVQLIPTAIFLLPYPMLLLIFFTRDRVVGSMT